MRASSATWGRISTAPSEQLTPTDSGFTWATERQKASIVWPERVRAEASVIATEIMIGSRRPRASKTSSIATRAAFAFSVSKMVSTSRRSTSPSSRASTCS